MATFVLVDGWQDEAGSIPKRDERALSLLNIQYIPVLPGTRDKSSSGKCNISINLDVFSSFFFIRDRERGAVTRDMIRIFYVAFLLVLATQSFAYYLASTRATKPLSHYFVDNFLSGNEAMPLRGQRKQLAHPTRRLGIGVRRNAHYSCGRHTARNSLRLSGVGSTAAPPPPTQVRSEKHIWRISFQIFGGAIKIVDVAVVNIK